MSWASHRTSEMPTIPPGSAGRHRAAGSAEMARTGMFGHPAPDGTDPGERMRRAGYGIGRDWAENIARGQPSAVAVMAAWLGSTAHRGNMLNCALHAVGIGTARDGAGQIYWTQDFGGR